MAGVWVNSTGLETCNIVIPPEVQLFTCVAGLGVNPDLVGAQVTNLTLCEAPTFPNICPADTELGGVFVNNTDTDCDVSITTNPEAQCLKCADLAVFDAGVNVAALDTAATELRGSTTNNIFTVCDDADPRTGFNALVTSTAAETAFDTCLDNAAVSPGVSSLVQAQASSLQENSLTTNIKPEAEIPSFNTEPQNPSLDALLENPHLKALLENPELDALLENPDGNALLQDPDVKALLEDPSVNALLEDPSVKAQLEKPTISALTGLFP
jgi:hypothetical protein